MAEQEPMTRNQKELEFSTDYAWSELASRVVKSTGISVAYESQYHFSPGMTAARFGLTNGLKIILMWDRRAPVFTYQTWFRVGSRNENPDRTGLAHLFEHLMFKGTALHPSGNFDREMESRGAETNAATWVDWTYYTEALVNVADNFEAVVGFETDRMTGLILDETTFRSELEVVKNERRMCIDDSVSGTLTETLYRTAFGNHAYSWPTLGAMEHLEASTTEDLKQFYKTYYAPNNATVVVVGDLDFEVALELLAKSYSLISAQPIPDYVPASLSEPHNLELIRLAQPISTPQLVVGFLALAESDPRYPALEILTEVLVNGESSRLYRRLVVDESLALDVSGYLTPFAERGLVEFSIVVRPEVEPERLLAAFQEELDALATVELPSAELAKAKNSLELSWLMSVRTAEGFAEVLGHYESNSGDYSLAFRLREGWEQVNSSQCKELAASLFKSSKRVAILAEAPNLEEE